MLCAIALGAGCWQARSEEHKPVEGGIAPAASSTPEAPSGPTPLETAGRTPKEVTDRIKLVASSVLVMHENVSGVDPALVAETGMGLGENMRTVVVHRFAPGNLAEVGWKLDYAKAAAGKATNMQVTGKVLDDHLLDAYKIYPPALWPEGDGGGLGSGIIWLSQDVYENFTHGGMSSFYFGLTDADFLRVLRLKPNSRLAAASLRLKLQGDRVIDEQHKDVYLAKVASSTVERQLIVNGDVTTVQAMKVSSWFGDMYVLKNPYYPLVLEVRMSDAVRKEFGTLFDYEITELKDVQG